MQIPLIFNNSLPLTISTFKASQSAMSTLILKEAKSLDLSRLSLIRYSSSLLSAPKGIAVFGRATLSPLKTSEAGKHHLITVELSENEQEPFAIAQYEIIDRKRGLKTAILHKLWEPETCMDHQTEPKLLKLSDIFEKFPTLTDSGFREEKWPLEAFLAIPLVGNEAEQALNIQTNLSIFGSANSQMPCEIFESQRLGTKPGLLEVFQENVLIAQLN